MTEEDVEKEEKLHDNLGNNKEEARLQLCNDDDVSDPSLAQTTAIRSAPTGEFFSGM